MYIDNYNDNNNNDYDYDTIYFSRLISSVQSTGITEGPTSMKITKNQT